MGDESQLYFLGKQGLCSTSAPSANQSKRIMCGLRSPVLSLSFCGGPACFSNNALFNWILFGGHLNANLVMKETLKIYVCLIL